MESVGPFFECPIMRQELRINQATHGCEPQVTPSAELRINQATHGCEPQVTLSAELRINQATHGCI